MHLPTPDFSAAPLRCVAGLRPYRAGSYRLERDPGAHPGKLIESLKLSAKEKKGLLSETAREFLGLS